jgi:hypothetical protein
VLEVDSRTGKILWNAPKYEDCAGKAVFRRGGLENERAVKKC